MADVPMRYELHTIIEHLKDEARKDRECGWPKKAEKKEQAAELLRRAYASGVSACSSNGTVDCQSTAVEQRCAVCPHGVLPSSNDQPKDPT